jgi:hypothetical protein
MAEFNYHRFHRRRQMLKTAGWAAVAIGLFCLLDLFFKEPMPLRGRPAIFAGLSLLAIGGVLLNAGYKLPVTEAIEILHQRHEGITASELIHLMRVDRVTADRIIAILLEKGFLKSSAKRSEAEQVFDVVK